MSLFKPFCLSSDFSDGNRYCITYDSSTVHTTFEVGLLNMQFLCASSFTTLLRNIRLYLNKLKFKFIITDNLQQKNNEIEIEGIGKKIPSSKVSDRIIKKIKTVLSYCVFQQFTFDKVKKIFYRYYLVEGNVFLRKLPSFPLIKDKKNKKEKIQNGCALVPAISRKEEEIKDIKAITTSIKSEESKPIPTIESVFFRSKVNFKIKAAKKLENEKDKAEFMAKLDRFMYIINNFIFTKKFKVNEELYILVDKVDPYLNSVNNFIHGKTQEIMYIQNLGRRNFVMTTKPQIQYGRYELQLPIVKKKKHYKKVIEVEDKYKKVKNYVPQVIKYLYIKNYLKGKHIIKERSKAKL